MNKLKLVLGVLLMAAFAACNQSELEQAQNDKMALMEEMQQLRLTMNSRDSSLNEVMGYFNEIESNLEEIKKREGIISVSASSGELREGQKSKIVEDIQVINGLMQENKKKVTELRRLLQNKGVKIKELEVMLDRLTTTLGEKDEEIASLKEDLGKMKIEFKLLQMENMEKTELIAMQEQQLNKGYYCFGTVKELKKNGVISKDGGLAGMLGGTTLTGDFNREYFQEIDVLKSTNIELFAKKATLLTSHPTGSYSIQGENESADKLIIKDPSAFWSASKFLVIKVE